MVIISALLCLATVVKLAAILNAIRWLAGDAAQYRRYVIRNKPQTMRSLEVLLEVYHANFFPFGLKDYRLIRYMRQLPRKSIRGAATWWILAVFQKVISRFQGLALVSAAFFVFGAHIPPRSVWASRDVYGGIGATLGILLMVCIILLACESFMSYVVLGSYGVAFHSLDVRRRSVLEDAARSTALAPQSEDRNPALVEMIAYAGIFITAFVVMASATYFISMQLGGFSALVGRIGPGLVDSRRLYDAFYCAVNIAGGSSDAEPVTVLAMLLAMIGTIAYFLLAVIVLAGLASVISREPSRSD